MKYLSFLFFAALLIWTWNLTHNTEGFSFETHAGIQSRLMDLISETIKAKRPDSANVNINKIWTEPMSENKIRAYFSYKFQDKNASGETTESNIEGEATLSHTGVDENGNDVWNVDHIKTTNDSVSFAEGLKIYPFVDENTETLAPESKDTNESTTH